MIEDDTTKKHNITLSELFGTHYNNTDQPMYIDLEIDSSILINSLVSKAINILNNKL